MESRDTTTGRGAVDVNREYPEPTEEELQTLRKVAGSIPWISYALCVVEFAERASYYGMHGYIFQYVATILTSLGASQLFTNFLQKPLPKGGNGAGAPPHGTQQTAGALNKGLQFANAFLLLFRFLSYSLPILGA